MSGRSTLRRSREIKYVFDRKSPQPESRPSSSHYTRSQNLAPVPTTTDRLIGAFADDVTTDGGYEDNEEEDDNENENGDLDENVEVYYPWAP